MNFSEFTSLSCQPFKCLGIFDVLWQEVVFLVNPGSKSSLLKRHAETVQTLSTSRLGFHQGEFTYLI